MTPFFDRKLSPTFLGNVFALILLGAFDDNVDLGR
jgi:hypothetical protein